MGVQSGFNGTDTPQCGIIASRPHTHTHSIPVRETMKKKAEKLVIRIRRILCFETHTH